MKTILVTGGAGFIGSHLAERLVDLGHEVTVADNFSTGRDSNLAKLRSKITLVRADLAANYQDLPNQLHSTSWEIIYHLACHPRQNSFANPWLDLEVNLKSTISMLELAKRHGAKIIYSSNSGIYGVGEGRLPIDESFPDDPASPYDVHKLSSENMIKIYNRTYSVPCTIFRFATVYGPRQRSSSNWKPVIAEFTEKLLKGEAPEIWGDGNSTRDFIYVSDIADALVAAMDTQTTYEPLILSTNTETAIRPLYKMIASIVGSDIEPHYSAARLGEIRRMLLSNSRAKSVLGWQPKVSLLEGLNSVVQWMEKQTSVNQGTE